MSEPPLPASFGRYRTLALLGRGAMGTVYRAHDPLIGRQVAIKVVHTERLDAATRQEYLARFGAEAQAAGRCNHPGIVAIYDLSAEGEQPFIVMELVEGASFRQVLGDPERRRAVNSLAVIGEVLEGLAFAHGQGVIHRDIKPANILLSKEGRAKIADFGIARLDEGATTGTGAMLGTPNYMAPEQIIGGVVDHRADLFAVGVILYEALTGGLPFAGRNLSETLLRLANNEPADLAPVLADHSTYAPIFARALAKRPADRFPSAGAFAQALRALGTDEAGTATVVLPGAGRRFDPAMLAEIEARLVRFVGPMARVLVRRAAEQAASREDLLAALAKELPRPEDAAQFLREHAARIEPRIGEPTGGTTTGLGRTGSRTAPVTPELLAIAEAALTFTIGPIARVLVTEAAGAATSAADLTERLAQHLRRPEDAARFRRQMLAAISGRKPPNV
ncbi:MAG: serine/threonine-protein kinase [Acetobacteraceae bacterium]